ncbi:MAG TPA: alpha/beta hydrolase family protein, partial [Nannocystis sp.]
PGTSDELEALLADLGRYNDPALLAEPDRLLAPPPAAPRLAVLERRPIADGRATHYSFASAYRPLHPTYAREYAGYDRLDTVHVHAWEHARPAPASIILVHGWAMGARRLHELEFSVASLFRDLGLDVYFYVQPFHGERRPSQARYNGQLFPSTDLVRTNEAFIQTCMDLRALLGAVLERRGGRVGMMGSSLGGYTSALIASVDPRLDFVVPIMAPASMAHLIWDHGAGDPFRTRAEGAGMTRDRFHHAWALHSPLSYQPRVPWERRLIVGAADDVLVRPTDVDVLWEHWQRPRRFTFAGGHILQLGRRAYIRELARFLDDLGVIHSRL